MRELLQNDTEKCCYQVATKCDKNLLENVSVITMCDRLLLQNASGMQSATFVTKWTKHFAQSTNYWWVIRPSATGWNQFLCESYIAIIDKYVSKLKCSNPRKWA